MKPVNTPAGRGIFYRPMIIPNQSGLSSSNPYHYSLWRVNDYTQAINMARYQQEIQGRLGLQSQEYQYRTNPHQYRTIPHQYRTNTHQNQINTSQYRTNTHQNLQDPTINECNPEELETGPLGLDSEEYQLQTDHQQNLKDPVINDNDLEELESVGPQSQEYQYRTDPHQNLKDPVMNDSDPEELESSLQSQQYQYQTDPHQDQTAPMMDESNPEGLPLSHTASDIVAAHDDDDARDESRGETPRGELDSQIVEFTIMAPKRFRQEELQAIIDAKLAKSLNKRPYDKSHLGDEFNDGGAVWGILITNCRLVFARYLSLSDADIPGFIDAAAGGRVDRSSRQYTKAYTRVMEWRKNWFSAFASEVDNLQIQLEKENDGYAALPTEQLRDAYSQLFRYELFYRLMGTTNAMVDWRATLAIPKMLVLYQTVFTYSLVYSHTYRHFPKTLSKMEGRERMRLVARAPAYKEIGVDQLILLPEKPPAKLRQYKRRKPSSLLALDPSFVPFGVSQNDRVKSLPPNPNSPESMVESSQVNNCS